MSDANAHPPFSPSPEDQPSDLDVFAVGRSIFGPGAPPPPPEVAGYSILAFVARGGLGQVWHALRNHDGLEVALKLPNTPNPDTTDRLLAEAEALRKLEHPGIVRLHELTHDTAGDPVLVMEFVAGPPLRAVLPAEGYDFRAALDIFLPVLDAVHYAHGRGLVHRDLKPSNILLDAGDRPRITDFGLATSLQQRQVSFALTQSGLVAGTVEYLAPECYQPGHQPGVATDLYALGVMLYELLTGSPPRGSWPPLSQVKKLDVRLDELVADALHPDPAQRLTSAALFKKRLEEIRDSPPRYAGTPLLTRPVRALDAAWTIVGLYLLAAGYCSQQRINNTDVPRLFDLTFGHTQYLGGFWATWVMTIVLGFMGAWQAVRLWHFRHVPVREALPAFFGLRLGASRGVAFLTATAQALCFIGPLVYICFIAGQTWRWLTPDTPALQHALVITKYKSDLPVSPWTWDPPNFLRSEDYWIREVVPTPDGGYYSLDRQNFFIFLLPLLMTLGVAGLLLGLLSTLVAPLLCRRQGRVVVSGVLVLAVSGAGWWGVSEWKAEVVRTMRYPQHTAAWLDALIADVLTPRDETAPSLRHGLAFGAWVWKAPSGKQPKNEFLRWFDAAWSTETRRHQVVESLRPRDYAVGELPDQFSRGYDWKTYADPPHAPATASYDTLRCDFQIKGYGPDAVISSWLPHSHPLYVVTPRELTTADAETWLREWFQCLSTPGCPGLERFLAPLMLHLDKGDHGRDRHELPLVRDVPAAALRAERARWHSLICDPEPLAAPPATLPGARRRIIARVRLSGVRATGRPETLSPATWTFDLIPSETGWQAFRVRW